MIKPNLHFVQYIGTFLRKLHTKKRKKVIRPFVTPTDDSALEKLRCLLHGGLKSSSFQYACIVHENPMIIIGGTVN